MIKTTDIAWAAGIYEGEGNFTGHSATVGQNDRWLCDKLESLFGGSVNQQPSRADTYYVWTISGKECRAFLLTIFTFLSQRRKNQIKKHKTFFIDPNFKRLDVCREGHPYTEENTLVVQDKRNPQGWVKRCKICEDIRKKAYKNGVPLDFQKMLEEKVRERKENAS